jgi:hypothetical protein
MSMEKQDLQLYQREVKLQCQIALLSEAQIRPAYALMLETWPADGAAQFWMPVQAFLTAYANISKLLWGVKRDAHRARELRASLGVTTEFHFKGDGRAVRDDFEHIDELLDLHRTAPGNHHLVFRSTGDPAMISGIALEDYLAFYNPDTNEVTFLGKTFNLSDLRREVEALLPKVQAELAKPPW